MWSTPTSTCSARCRYFFAVASEKRIGLGVHRKEGGADRRNKITLMEEIGHIHLRHAPSSLIPTADGLQARDYIKAQEEEAYGVGAAALIPWGTFFPALNVGRTIDELTESYDVTPELIQYRIKITGASRLYQARQRAQRTTGAARF